MSGMDEGMDARSGCVRARLLKTFEDIAAKWIELVLRA